MYTRVAPRATRTAAAALGGEPVGSARGDPRLDRGAAPTGARCGRDGARRRPPTRGSRGSRGRASPPATSDRAARERRQSVPALARIVVRGNGRRARGRRIRGGAWCSARGRRTMKRRHESRRGARAAGRGAPAVSSTWENSTARAPSADRTEPAVRRRRHGAAAHRRDHRYARRRALRADAGGPLGAVASRPAARRSRSSRPACPAVRAISACACPGTSAA